MATGRLERRAVIGGTLPGGIIAHRRDAFGQGAHRRPSAACGARGHGEDASRRLPPETLGKVSEEMADVLLYLVRLADKLDVDLVQAAKRKMAINAQKYPAEIARGSSRKYTEL